MPLREAIFQQDGAPSHNNASTRAWFERHCPELRLLPWPSSSPDVAPHDFSLWSRLVTDMPQRCTNKVELIAAVIRNHREVVPHVDNAALLRAVEERLRLLVLNGGDHFEVS